VLDVALRAIADPRRREILRLVQAQERTSGDIAAHFDVTGPAVSQHLVVLEEAGLVSVRRLGTRRLYRARPEGLRALRAFLNEFWDAGLQRLAAAAESDQRSGVVPPSEHGGVVERQVRVAAAPETVFGFFVDPEKLVRWMGITAELVPRPGGRLRIHVNGPFVAGGRYLEVVPYTRVVFTWGWEGAESPVPVPLPAGSSTVEVTLTADGDSTIVRLRHYGLPAGAEAEYAGGWDHYLPRLVIAGSGGDPGPDVQ
jgi:uncharacterized protein YndB with AHSA1/START domain/DNA-binding transcriptional ArsR family regulator